MMSAPTSAAAGPQLPAHLTSLTIGYVLLQVFSTNFVLADKQAAAEYDLNPPQPYAHALTRIWPAARWASRCLAVGQDGWRLTLPIYQAHPRAHMIVLDTNVLERHP